MEKKGIEVGLRLGGLHVYPEAFSCEPMNGHLNIEQMVDDKSVVIAIYAPGEWTYGRYIQS